MLRLSEVNAATLCKKASVAAGDYPRTDAPKVVHLGVGAFHRAHQAAYFDTLNNKSNTQTKEPWLIHGASLRSPTAASQLNPQDGLYLHVTQDAYGSSTTLVRSIVGVINAFESPKSLIDMIAAQTTQLITLTITEKGYCLNAETGELDRSLEDVKHDCQSLDRPQTAIGYLVSGLAARRSRGNDPVTILSCDNLPHNGQLTRRAVLALANIHNTDLAQWIVDYVSFPSSMVDRIAPAISGQDRESVEQSVGLEDQGLSITEQFSQWVIEDNFAGEKPALDSVGVEFVPSVDDWENRKLRLLNAAHSGLAYLGGLADLNYVHEAINDQALVAFINGLWEEAGETLATDPGFDPKAYCDSLLTRFANPHLNHKLHQIAMDGSQKLPQRILAAWRERAQAGRKSPHLATVVAAWLHWQWGKTYSGNAFQVSDPAHSELIEIIGDSDRTDQSCLKALINAYEPLLALCELHPNCRAELLTAFHILSEKFF